MITTQGDIDRLFLEILDNLDGFLRRRYRSRSQLMEGALYVDPNKRYLHDIKIGTLGTGKIISFEEFVTKTKSIIKTRNKEKLFLLYTYYLLRNNILQSRLEKQKQEKTMIRRYSQKYKTHVEDVSSRIIAYSTRAIGLSATEKSVLSRIVGNLDDETKLQWHHLNIDDNPSDDIETLWYYVCSLDAEGKWTVELLAPVSLPILIEKKQYRKQQQVFRTDQTHPDSKSLLDAITWFFEHIVMKILNSNVMIIPTTGLPRGPIHS